MRWTTLSIYDMRNGTPMANVMAADHASKCMQWKYTNFIPTLPVLGDSQINNMHQHFHPRWKDAPAFHFRLGIEYWASATL